MRVSTFRPQSEPQPNAAGRATIDFPLLADTRSEQDVADLVEDILHCIERRADRGRPLSQADVLQGLSIVTAVQTAKSETASRVGRDFGLTLLDLALSRGGTERGAAMV